VLIPRVIPTLSLADEQFVKTIRFDDPRYVGDPVNVIDLFNRFEVDEIVLLEIRATVEGRHPPFALLEELAAECWVPLTYGGAVRSVDDARTILGLGIEKVILGTAAADDPILISGVAETFGSQAVVVAVDARARPPGGWDVVVESGRRVVGRDPADYARTAAGLGAGEVLVTAVERDGTMVGYDVGLVRTVVDAVDVPVIACGGAGSRSHLVEPIRAGASAVAAGSLFVFRGPGGGVLINFPERRQLEGLLA
jgi:cyclase